MCLPNRLCPDALCTNLRAINSFLLSDNSIRRRECGCLRIPFLSMHFLAGRHSSPSQTRRIALPLLCATKKGSKVRDLITFAARSRLKYPSPHSIQSLRPPNRVCVILSRRRDSIYSTADVSFDRASESISLRVRWPQTSGRVRPGSCSSIRRTVYTEYWRGSSPTPCSPDDHWHSGC